MWWGGGAAASVLQLGRGASCTVFFCRSSADHWPNFSRPLSNDRQPIRAQPGRHRVTRWRHGAHGARGVPWEPMGPMVRCGPLRSMSPMAPTGAHGPRGAHWPLCPMKPMEPHEPPWYRMGPHGPLAGTERRGPYGPHMGTMSTCGPWSLTFGLRCCCCCCFVLLLLLFVCVFVWFVCFILLC